MEEGATVAGTRSSSRQRTDPPRRSLTAQARGGRPARSEAAWSPAEAAARVLDVVRDSVAFAPTTVVWLVDVSPSAMDWGRDIHSELRRFYSDVVPTFLSGQKDRLLTGLITISQSVESRLASSADLSACVAAWDALRVESSGRERTFEAVQQALDEYLPVRRDQQREVVFVIISDEAGDDWPLIDQLVDLPRRYALPVYVIGVPASCGRTRGLDDDVERPAGAVETPPPPTAAMAWQPILQGPESRELELIQLEYEDPYADVGLLDAGFGPFALEWLCRASGGTFLAVRRPAPRSAPRGVRRSQWPTPAAGDVDPQVMRPYTPDYLDAAGYRALYTDNAACRALHDAAQLPPAGVLRDIVFRFERRDEAELKNRLDRAQQAAAKVAPAIDLVYETLSRGAADADQIASPRWRAAYDLALGRAAAAKARTDGYNAMLAALKRGRAFTRPDSRVWVLERAAAIEDSSSLQALIDRARTHLQRVVAEHPQTPWARMAQYELETPMGWQWTEEP